MPDEQPSRESLDRIKTYYFKWLQCGLTGCRFARWFATKAKDRIGTWVDPSARGQVAEPEIIGALIEQFAAADRVAALLFPQIQHPDELAEVLSRLVRDRRWTLERLDRGHRPREQVAIALWWSGSGGYRASAMGFAPLMTMPVSRRSNDVALVVWGGGHQNVHRPGDAATTGIVDIPIGLGAKPFRRMWDETRQETKELLDHPRDDPSALRTLTFCLPASSVARHLPQLVE